MHLNITTKQFDLSDKDQKYLEKLVKKLMNLIPWKEPDNPLLDVILRRHKKKSLDHTEKKLIQEDEVELFHKHKTINNPIYYDGTLDLILPKKRLVINMLGKTVHEAIKDGFDELLREFNKYKGKHFENDSEYFNHSTIRQKQSENI